MKHKFLFVCICVVAAFWPLLIFAQGRTVLVDAEGNLVSPSNFYQANPPPADATKASLFEYTTATVNLSTYPVSVSGVFSPLRNRFYELELTSTLEGVGPHEYNLGLNSTAPQGTVVFFRVGSVATAGKRLRFYHKAPGPETYTTLIAEMPAVAGMQVGFVKIGSNFWAPFQDTQRNAELKALTTAGIAVQDSTGTERLSVDSTGAQITGALTVSGAITGTLNSTNLVGNIPSALLPATVSQVEAEAGTVTDPRTWTPERVKQAVDANAKAAVGLTPEQTAQPAGVALTTPSNNIVFDPLNRWSTPYVNFDGKTRWFAGAGEMELITNDTTNPYGLRTLRHVGGTVVYVGKYVYLADANLRIGDTITVAIRAKRDAGNYRAVLFAYNAVGLVGTINNGTTLAGNGTIQTLTASGVIPAGTTRIAVLIHNRTTTNPIDIYAMWGNVGNAVTAEPDFAEPNIYHVLMAQPPTETFTEITVAPSGGDFTTITAALASITTNSATNRYRILVEAGTYTEAGPSGNGLVLKSHVDIVGVGRDLVIVKGPGNSGLSAPIDRPANCTISGMTLRAVAGDKYALHVDHSSSIFTSFVVRNIRLIHEDPDNFALGFGMYAGGQTFLLEDVEILGKAWGHSTFGARTGTETDSYEVTFRGCSMDSFLWVSYIEYFPSKIVFEGCKITNYFRYQVGSTYYDANPSDPLYNRGYKADLCAVVFAGTNAGRLEMGTGWTDVRNVPFELPNVSARVYNSSGSTIPKGAAMKLLVDPGTDPLTGAALHHANVALWDGSGIYMGVAVEAIPASNRGAVQLGDRPLVSADGTTAIVYGDALELNSSGVFVKRTSGVIRGYALAPLASGTGLIPMLVQK